MRTALFFALISTLSVAACGSDTVDSNEQARRAYLGLDKSIGKWIAGDEMSIADFCLGPIVHRCLRFPVELPELPNLQRWDGVISTRQAFKKATAA